MARMADLYIPPHWNESREGEFPWPEWERTCPNCGRYHRYFHIVSGEQLRCAYTDCNWMGSLPVTGPEEGEDG